MSTKGDEQDKKYSKYCCFENSCTRGVLKNLDLFLQKKEWTKDSLIELLMV